MRIKLSCPSCFHDFSVSDELLGRRVKCPSCSEAVRVTDAGDDEDDDEPVQRSRKSSKSSSKGSSKRQAAKSGGGNAGLAIGLGVGGGVIALGLIVVVAIMLMRPGNGPANAVAGTPAQAAAVDPGAPAAVPAAQPAPIAPPVAAPPLVAPPAVAANPPPPGTEVAKATPPTPIPSNPAPSAPADSKPATKLPQATVDDSAPAKEMTVAAPLTGDVIDAVFAKLQGVPEPASSKLDLPDLIDRVEAGGVVRINVITSEGASTGSGFVVSTDGTVVTNYHVVTDAVRATVEFSDGTKGKVLGYRHVVPKSDIAIIKIDVPADKLRPVPLARELPKKGVSVATFGSPNGLSFTTSEGVISAIRSEADMAADTGLDMIGTWLQTDASISPGNSGGPLVDKFGRVVGINTMQLSSGQNLNFAMTIPEVIRALSAAPDKVKELKPEDLPHYERNKSRKIASDEYDTERGRRLFSEVKEIVVLNGASVRNFDPSGNIWDRVILRSKRAVEKSGIELSFGKPRPDIAILVVILEMNPSKKGTDGTQELSITAELTCVDPLAKRNESPLAKVWKSKQVVGSVSLASAARGKVPESVDGKIANFFGSFRTAYNRAVKQTKDAEK